MIHFYFSTNLAHAQADTKGYLIVLQGTEQIQNLLISLIMEKNFDVAYA